LEERANIRAYKTCVQAQRLEFRESHVTALSVAGGAPSHAKQKPAVVRYFAFAFAKAKAKGYR